MKTLYVLYDPECAFCVRCRNWLANEPSYVALRFIPRHSPEIAMRFPGIEQYQNGDDLVVISDEGAVYKGPGAFIMCLFALKEYREWSMRLAQPHLLPFAKTALELLSKHRSTISRWLGTATDDQLAHALK